MALIILGLNFSYDGKSRKGHQMQHIHSIKLKYKEVHALLCRPVVKVSFVRQLPIIYWDNMYDCLLYVKRICYGGHTHVVSSVVMTLC